MSNEIEKDENLDLVEQETNSNALKTEAEQGGFDFTTPSPNEGMASGPVENFLDNQSSRLGNWIDDTFQGDQTTQEELLDERQRQKVAGIANEQDRQDALNESTDLVDVIPREVIRAPLGAIEDAANSVALTVDKTGDEFKKQINQALGRPVNPDQDPSSDEYESWFDGSNKIIAENQTAVGKFARGIGEFWVLTRWSGKALGPAKGKASTMLGNTQLVRAANPMIQSNRYSRWASEVGKRIWQVGSDGVIADFVMSSSEGKNLANLAEEHAPWLLPDLTAALSADPEDTWYVERFKGALVGTSFNYVGHIVGGIVKGAWKSGRWMLAQKKAGKSLTEEILNEGDKIFNNTINEELSKGVVNDQSVADRLSEVRYEYGKGINPNNSKDEYILKHLDIEDQAEYGRLLDGNEPSEWFVNSLEKRGKADLDVFRNLRSELDPNLDTRGEDIFYHGAADEFELDNITHLENQVYKQKSLYGPGFYATDDLTTAGKYQKKNKARATETAQQTIYEVSEKTPVKFFDLDQPTPNNILAKLEDLSSTNEAYNDIIGTTIDELNIASWSTKPKKIPSLAKIIDTLTENLYKTDYNHEFRDNIISELQLLLKGEGFGGFTHKGGKKAGKNKRIHQVKIYWDPKDSIDITKLDTGGLTKSPELGTQSILNLPEAPSLRELAMNDYFELAQRIGGRKGDTWLPIQNMSLVQSAENVMREFDPIVNADGSADFQRVTYDGGVVKYDKVKGDYQVSMEDLEKMWKELQWNFREEGSLDTAYRTIDEPYISKAAAGNKQLYDIYKEVADDMDQISMGMKEADYKMTVEADIELARPFMEPIAKFIDGKDVDIVKEYKRILKSLRAKGGTDKITYDFIRDPSDVTKSGRVRTKRVTVPGVSQMRANLFILHSLGKITAKLAKNTLDLNNNLPLTRNWEMFTDLMKVMYVENKLWGFHWGKQGQGAQAGVAEVFAQWKKPPKAKYAEIQQEADEIFTELENLYKAGDKEAVNDLLQMALMTNGQVTSLTQIPEYLGRKLLNRPGAKGMATFTGQLEQVPARTIDELYQTVIQSWLGHPKTAVNALFMTNALNMARTLEGWIGANLPWRKYTFKESELVGTIYEGMDYSQFKKAKIQLLGIQWSSLQRAQFEAWEMFKRNWEINQKPKVFDEDGGVIFRKPDYGSKFDDNTDNAQWENLGHFYEKYGTAMQKKGYGLVNSLYKINKVPLMRSNRSVMNAGDAYTRTIIGRQQMAVSAAEQAIKDGLDLDDLPEFIKKNDEIFREKIFRKNKDDMWVVKDPRATAIGDEVTLMKQIPEQFKGFQVLERNPWSNRFFAFMRPSFNNAGNVFDRTPLKVFTEQYRDIVEIGSAESAQRWNLTLDELPRARDEMVGRMALGTTLAGIVWGLALNGNIIGDYPADEADRKLWKLNKIQPNSVAIPKPYNPLTQEKGANGWIYVSFGRSDIAGTLFSMVANGAYYADVMGEDYFTQWESKMAWYFGMAVADVGVIQSASDLSSLFDTGTGNMPNPERSFAKLFRPQLGVGGQSRFLADLFDNTQKESNTFLEYVRQQDIIFKSNVPNDYDILGKNRGRGNVQPLRNGPHNPLLRLFNSLSPFTITSTEGDNVKKTLLGIRYNLGAEVSTLKGVPLNSQEKSDLKLVLAEDKEFRTDLEQMISSDLWQRNMNKYIELNKKNEDGWKAQENWFYTQIGSIFERAKNRATETLKDSERFPEYNNNSADSLFNRITVRGYQKDAASTSDTAYSESLYNQIEKIRKYGTTGVAPQ